MKSRVAFLLVVAGLLLIEPAYAGPGGKIASAVLETFWGKVAMAGLVVLFLPLILFVMLQEHLAERRARRDLRFMAAYSPLFDWLKVRERARDCFHRVHASWSDEELAEAADWMTSWYWQSQQLVCLERWRRDGLQNICEVRKIKSMRPLLFVHRNQGREHEDSMLVIAINAEMTDYLQKRDSGELVEGSRKLKEVERVWTFTLQDGRWLVSDIDDGSTTLSFARMRRELPTIESTLQAELRA